MVTLWWLGLEPHSDLPPIGEIRLGTRSRRHMDEFDRGLEYLMAGRSIPPTNDSALKDRQERRSYPGRTTRSHRAMESSQPILRPADDGKGSGAQSESRRECLYL